MIQEYFGFTSEPFTKDILPEHLFRTPRFEELLARLEYGVKKRYFISVSLQGILEPENLQPFVT